MEILRTIDGQFAVGCNKDYCINRHDRRMFDKIDKDGDGILSDKEIIARRKKEARKGQIVTVLGLAAGIPVTLHGLNKKSMLTTVLGAGFCLITAFNQSIINSEKEKTENYEKEHKLNTNG